MADARMLAVGTHEMRNLGMVALCAALGGCASSAADIAPAYVSPVAYQSYTCQQLALEAQAISTRAHALWRTGESAYQEWCCNCGCYYHLLAGRLPCRRR